MKKGRRGHEGFSQHTSRQDRGPLPVWLRVIARCKLLKFWTPAPFGTGLPIYDGHSPLHPRHPNCRNLVLVSFVFQCMVLPLFLVNRHNVPSSSAFDATRVATVDDCRRVRHRSKIREHSTRRQEVHMEGHRGKMESGSRRAVLVQHQPDVCG